MFKKIFDIISLTLETFIIVLGIMVTGILSVISVSLLKGYDLAEINTTYDFGKLVNQNNAVFWLILFFGYFIVVIVKIVIVIIKLYKDFKSIGKLDKNKIVSWLKRN
jgi:hypothetical protein